MNPRKIKRLLGTLESYSEEQNHCTISESIHRIDPNLETSNEQFFALLRQQTDHNNCHINTVVLTRLYEICSNEYDLTKLVETAATEYNRKPENISNDVLLEFLNSSEWA